VTRIVGGRDHFPHSTLLGRSVGDQRVPTKWRVATVTLRARPDSQPRDITRYFQLL